MKTIKELLVFIALMCSTTLWAYDFEAMNDDGVTIYYNVLSDEDLTCEVTYLYYNSSSNNEAYSGEVSIPETATYNGTMYTVTAIGSCAFYNCSALTNVTIPNSVTSIGSYSFWNCSGLTEITIPEGVTSIGQQAFCYCRGLTGCLIIPDSVTTIGDYAFEHCSGLTGELIIPNCVTTIGNGAFEDCSALESITIPNSVETIGIYPFSGCTGLTQFEVADGNEYYCSADGVLFTKDMTVLIQFPAASSMMSYSIPNSVTEIGSFAYCIGLTEVSIPGSVKWIDASAFYGCVGLTEISIPKSVIGIANNAFNGCLNLTRFEVEDGNGYYCAVDGVLYSKDKTTLVQFPLASPLLPSFDIPDGVTTIGNGAFEDCAGLTEIKIPEGVTEIGQQAFYYCTNLAEVTIPNSVTSIGHNAFRGCTALTKVVIGNSVEKIDTYAFCECKSLKSVTIGNGVTTIGEYAFYKCTGLVGTITIPESVTMIGDWAFAYCSRLTSVNIGNSVTAIGSIAFHDCSSLESIYSLNPEPPTCGSSGFGVFYNVDKGKCVLYVPEGSKDAYSTAYAWQDFKNIVEMDMTSLRSITAGSNTEATGYYTTDGKQVSTPQRGINIIRYSDGSAKKVLVR